MHVCIVSQEYPPDTAHGGIGTQSWNKAQGLTGLEHSVDVLSAIGGKGDRLQTSRAAGVTVHRMPPPDKQDEGVTIYDPSSYMVGYGWSVLRYLNQLQRKKKFDLINFPDYGAEGLPYQLNRSIWNWTPVIVHLHGPLAMFTEEMGWPHKESRFFRMADFMDGESIRLADGFLATSANIADFVARRYGIDRRSIQVVHCGIDINLFRPAPKSVCKSPHRPTVLFVGNITPDKGVLTIFNSVMKLASKYPDILLRIVGKDNSGTLSKKILKQAEEQGRRSNVEILPYVRDRHMLPALYQQASVFASPATHEPGVANVYVEAMACGCPVICGDTGGAPEAVREGETGFMVPPRDVEATAAVLDRLLGDDEARTAMGHAARSHAEGYFSLEKYLMRVLAGYEAAIVRGNEKLAAQKDAEGQAV